MMELTKAGTSDVLVINSISKRAFDSDILVGASSKTGPPGYMSVSFHMEMAKANHLYKLSVDGIIVGGAILFVNGLQLNIGRIFVDPAYFRKGYGIFIMQEIERIFSDVREIFLDTPIWNVRTNAFYQKLGYIKYKKEDEFICYIKRIGEQKNWEDDYTMKKIHYIKQPTGYLCGQACVAMLAGVTVEEVSVGFQVLYYWFDICLGRFFGLFWQYDFEGEDRKGVEDFEVPFW